MTRPHSTEMIKIRTVPYQEGFSNCKVVFVNLEEILKSPRFGVKAFDTRESGRGTPVATRILTPDFKGVHFTAPITLFLVKHQAARFNAKVVLVNLEEELNKHGIVVQEAATREKGQKSRLAIRVRV